jgi:phosphate transport system permease protein
MKTWFKSGSPWIWLNGGAVALCMIMVVGLIGLITIRGFGHFWQSDVAQIVINAADGTRSTVLGELVRQEVVSAAVARDSGEQIPADVELVTRYLIKQGNRDQTGRDFVWYIGLFMEPWEYPESVMVLERREWGNLYGYPLALLRHDELVVTADSDGFEEQLQQSVRRSLDLHDQIQRLEKQGIGRINTAIESLRLEERALNLQGISGDALMMEQLRIATEKEVLESEYVLLRDELDELYESTERDTLKMRTSDGSEVDISLETIVRFSAPNTMSTLARVGQYMEKLWEFLSDDPREANTEGGIFPAIFGTVTMVLVMSIMVTPFGILAAIYLREYARQGLLTRIIRISVYNLAGVPSIVYGVFGLGFFIYFLGGNIDQMFYPEALPAPTFGTPGLFWVSLTLALLTLPIVIVSTEEGLARIPSTIRQGSLALGATKAETLWKVIIPLATPAMMTGLILAIARAAGEVAPLMLVGVVKLAPTLPIDAAFPFIHLERKIMHLGFHIYDVGFQSPNVEAARPLVYATALVLVMLIMILNLTAISIRNHLRERYRSASD